MSAYAEQRADQERPAAPAPAPAPDGSEPPPQDAAGQQEEPDEPQEAHAARRELIEHTPEFILGASAAFGGSLVGGDQHGVSGGQVAGDVYLGGRTEHHHHGPAGPRHASGEIPRAELDKLAAVFAESDSFGPALERLTRERVVILTGAHSTGRRAAALMLLHRIGVRAVRALDPDVSPAALPDQITGAHGHVLCELALSRGRPLREHHVLAVRERLREHDGYLVVTAERSAALHGVGTARWEPPRAADILHNHLGHLLGGTGSDEAAGLDVARDFLAHDHRPQELADFAARLADFHRGAASLNELAGFSRATVEQQVRQWFDDAATDLRAKAFLISLAVFDQAPYALAAELGDRLFAELQLTETPEEPARIPVFGPSPAERLRLARARGYEENEATEWGPVPQLMAEYEDSRTARVLLEEVWTGHPSARPALVRWIKQLAADRRPVVRTRAAACTAMLAAADLPSAMAQLIDGWATTRAFAPRLIAANALTLAHLLGVGAVPRILTRWCTDRHYARRWTAIRGYALLAPLSPDQAPAALDALAGRARTDASSEYEQDQLAQSAALLLAAGDRTEMLGSLAALGRQESPAVRSFVLSAFVTACAHTDEDGVLAWFTEEGAHSPDGIRDLATLWRLALNDRARTRAALGALRSWVYEAERRAETEFALATLLPELITDGEDLARLSHLLRTVPGRRGGPPPEVAGRLMTVLTARSPRS
ncbi:hypothetical protein ABZ953_04840 [Streptomyces sp. NPDC046465]|uniref:hypothetical protein n=1 Tax=Streptomyces sp. NPDC046465 TaxID=3155810 RepID=UPI0033DF4C53